MKRSKAGIVDFIKLRERQELIQLLEKIRKKEAELESLKLKEARLRQRTRKATKKKTLVLKKSGSYLAGYDSSAGRKLWVSDTIKPPRPPRKPPGRNLD
jgi:hypothetical protein